VSEIITHAEAGDPIRVTKISGSTAFLLECGGRSYLLSDDIRSRVAPSIGTTGMTTDADTPTPSLDLGTLFTADAVLESFSLRKAVTDGVLVATVGTVALSKVPTTA
jgi:hypothetical protein